MKITILGSGSGLAVPGRSASAILFESADGGFLIDAGDGTARQLARFGFDPNRISAIIISHTHSDHATGLFFLLQVMHLAGRMCPLRIYLPESVIPGFRKVFPLFRIFPEKWSFRFMLHPIHQGVFIEEDGIRIEPIPNGHLKESLKTAERHGLGSESYSFSCSDSEDHSVIVTSDIDGFGHLDRITRADVLISECTHLEPDDILAFARERSISRVVFTHVPQEKEEYASRQAGIPHAEFAFDGMTIEV